MARNYRFSRKISQEESEQIVKEMRKLDNVEFAEITSDLKLLRVKTKDNEYSDVMWKAVNICNRVAQGVEITFAGFAYES